MKNIWFVLFTLLSFMNISSKAQDLREVLEGKTYVRTFRAAGFKHIAKYSFYTNRVEYSVSGHFVNDTYTIHGVYSGNKFEGVNLKNGDKYVLTFEEVSANKITVRKEGVDSKYSWVKEVFPVSGSHEYFLEEN